MKSMISAAAAASALLSATSAAAEDLSVGYALAPVAVPTMTEWAMIGLCVALGAAALVAIQRRGSARGMAIGLAAILVVGAFAMPESSMADSLALTLDGTSPDLVNLPLRAANHIITVTNGSQGTVTLTSLTIVNGNQFTIAPGTTCDVGAQLTPGSSCTVAVIGNPA